MVYGRVAALRGSYECFERGEGEGKVIGGNTMAGDVM